MASSFNRGAGVPVGIGWSGGGDGGALPLEAFGSNVFAASFICC